MRTGLLVHPAGGVAYLFFNSPGLHQAPDVGLLEDPFKRLGVVYHFAGFGLELACQKPEQRRLSFAVGAYDAYLFARTDNDVEVLDELDIRVIGE